MSYFSISYDNLLKADVPVFHWFLRKVATQWVNKTFHNFFPQKGILVYFGYVKVDKITLQMVPISFIFKFCPGPNLFWLYYLSKTCFKNRISIKRLIHSIFSIKKSINTMNHLVGIQITVCWVSFAFFGNWKSNWKLFFKTFYQRLEVITLVFNFQTFWLGQIFDFFQFLEKY